jgi:hypothetical protein
MIVRPGNFYVMSKMAPSGGTIAAALAEPVMYMCQRQMRHRINRVRGHRLFVAASLAFLQVTAGLAADIEQSGPKPIIARIETYGLRSVSREDVIEASGLKVGDQLENAGRKEFDAAEIIRRIESVHGVDKASFAAIYGRLLENDTGLVVYLGIEEPGVQQLEFSQEPTGDSVLPGDIIGASDRAQLAFRKASANGIFEEDHSMGYSLSKDSELRNAQQAFVSLADEHWEQLVAVLHNSRDAKQRAIAAQVIAYAQDKKQIVRELIPAVRDPDAMVRNNSTRALSLMYSYSKAHPELAITVPPELVQTLLKMLHSLEWLDRNKAVGLLLSLDDDQSVLRSLKEQGVPALIEMSNWQTGHGMMAFMLLGKLAGMTHEESLEAWKQGKQSSIIARAKQLVESR